MTNGGLPESNPQRPDDLRRVALVTTTIQVPRFLGEVVENAEINGHADQLSLIVVGDRKTPREVGAFLDDLAKRTGARVTYLDTSAQRRFLRRWPSLDIFLRYDCIQRRNVGYLQAALDEAEVIISVDDDNFVTDDDFIGHHLAVGREVAVPVVSHPSGWWNICQRLISDPPRQLYHRGFPKSQQTWDFTGHTTETHHVKAVANAGLWLGVPDVDASAHIEQPTDVVSIEPVDGHRTCALASGTWCPMSSENVAYDASLLPAIYLPVMHDLVRGQRVGRMDDIWMSYFVRAIADELGDSVLYGPPLVTQERNPHDHVADLAAELPGYVLTEQLVKYLRSFASEATDYAEAYLELIYHLRDATEADMSLETPDREYFRQLTLGMAAWHGVVEDLSLG